MRAALRGGDGSMRRTRTLLLASLLVLYSCAPRLVGPTDQAFAARVVDLSPGAAVSVTSGGGSPRWAITAARTIQAKDLAVTIVDACLSACAEFILPATRRLTIEPTALVGFHGSDFWAPEILAAAGRSTSSCHSERLDWLVAAYASRGLRRDFHEQVKARLVMTRSEVRRSGACFAAVAYRKRSMWFPTSRQLRDLWGLQTTGVCADTDACWRRSLLRWSKPGEIFVIGDEVYRRAPDATFEDLGPVA